MTRRSALPGADELFRSTGDGREAPELDTPEMPTSPVSLVSRSAPQDLTEAPSDLAPVSAQDTDGLEAASNAVRTSARRRARAVAERRPSGRERHDEKITVYVSAEELIDLEQARLTLRGEHGMAVDRGRIVREALAVVLADLDAKGDASILVRRLRGR